MMENKINFMYLYPDIMNIHGDRGNVFAFDKVAESLGLKLNVTRVERLSDKPDFKSADIVFMPAGEVVCAQAAAAALMPYRDEIDAYIKSGKYFIVISSGIAAFAKETKRRDGSSFEGLGLINARCEEIRTAYSNDAVFVTDVFGEETEIVGGQIQMMKVILENETPLGKITYGYGNDKCGGEGIRKNNFIFTNLLGPVFVKNPRFAREILERAAEKKGIEVKACDEEYRVETNSNEEIKRYIDMKVRLYDQTRLDKENGI